MKKKYYLVNVSSEQGYSFVVYVNDKENNILEKCLEKDLFKCEDDYYCADVVDADDYDVQMFETCDCVYDI